MLSSKIKFSNVDEYISIFPSDIQNLLIKIRKTIFAVAPGAVEVISYNIPAYKYYGMLVYFAAYKNHIGFYPGSSIITEVFKNELKNYKTSKGAIQFPYEKQLPIRLIKEIVKFKMRYNLERKT